MEGEDDTKEDELDLASLSPYEYHRNHPELSRYKDSNDVQKEPLPIEPPAKYYNEDKRVVLNVGGKKFETYISTLMKYPNSLLGVMFQQRNSHLLKPDSNDHYFFDRSSTTFEIVMNFYRTGKLRLCSGVTREMLEDELDYFQLPVDTSALSGERLGNKLGILALSVLRKKVDLILSRIKKFIIETIHKAAMEGEQFYSIEFKDSQHREFYAFLSNFSHRELLLHDLLLENFDVSFTDLTSGQGHSYILIITLWNRYTRQTTEGDTTAALSKILEELRQGVEIKTSKDDHILSVKPVINTL